MCLTLGLDPELLQISIQGIPSNAEKARGLFLIPLAAPQRFQAQALGDIVNHVPEAAIGRKIHCVRPV